MKILVTGATGFVGQNLITFLLDGKHVVIASGRSSEKAKTMPWINKVEFVQGNIHSEEVQKKFLLSEPDILIHLAWDGLPNYKELFHFENNMPADYSFLKKMIYGGVKRIMVAGTCYEYGMQNGKLSEDMPAMPANPYAIAKNTLRIFLEELQKKKDFTLQWCRLFYMYGDGQNSKSILPMLDSAINNGETVFNMSGGEQLRDYQDVKETVKQLAFLVDNPSCRGIVNCCSGNPISIRSLVEQHIRKRNSSIRLNLGFYPYPDYEPMAFWGDNEKIIGEHLQ